MTIFSTMALLAMGAPASGGGQQQDPRAAIIGNLGLLVLMVVMFYFVLIRPQQKKQKAHTEMLKSVRAGDKIITSGGILAVVVTVKDKSLMVRSADAKFEITKSALSEVLERSGESQDS
jgi:preprotein translocase subunit YajC